MVAETEDIVDCRAGLRLKVVVEVVTTGGIHCFSGPSSGAHFASGEQKARL